MGPADIVAEANVFGGDRTAVRLVSPIAVDVLLPLSGRERISARAVYDGPVPAPIAKGQRFGALEVRMGDHSLRRLPLQAADDVAAGNLTQRASDGLRELVFGWWQ
jgi:D-alanyl-D-alanine carboxypeptidase (penicillin-binding protein 5/6)